MFYVVLTLLLSPFLLARRRARETLARILVIQTAKIGDVVMSTRLLGALRQSLPQASITVMHQSLTRDILQDHPGVDATIEVEPHTLSGVRGKLGMAARVRGERFDCVLVLSPSVPLLVTLVWAGMPRRLAVMPKTSGRTLRLARRLLSGFVEHDGSRPISDSQLELLPLLGCRESAAEQSVVMIDVPMAAELAGHQPLIGVGVNAGNSLKSLDEAQLARLCSDILAGTDGAVVLIGGAADADKARAIARRVADPRLLDLSGRYTLRELPALLARLTAYVGVDSGVTHLADALGIPQVVVAGPVNIVEFMPRTSGSRAITPGALPCAPCVFSFRTPYRCATGTHACVREVRIEAVVRTLQTVIAERGAKS